MRRVSTQLLKPIGAHTIEVRVDCWALQWGQEQEVGFLKTAPRAPHPVPTALVPFVPSNPV